jgi:O-antigen/teichoic acid export membrane protein
MPVRLAFSCGSVADNILVWWVGKGIYPGDRTFTLMILLLVIQIVVEPSWMLLIATTRHYGAAAVHTLESFLNLALSLWWVRTWGLSGVIAATVVARIMTSGWYIPAIAMRIMDAHLSSIRFTISAPVLISAGSLGIALSLAALRSSVFSFVPVPVAAGLASIVFAVAFAYGVFTRDERRAAMDVAFAVLQGRFASLQE